jgi:hypothetical protein
LAVPEREGDVDAAHDGVDRGGGPGRGGELDLGGGRVVDRGGPWRGLPRSRGGGVERGGVELDPARDGAGAGEEARLHPQLRGVRRQPRPQRGQQPRAQGLREDHRGAGQATLGLHGFWVFASLEWEVGGAVRIAAVGVEALRGCGVGGAGRAGERRGRVRMHQGPGGVDGDRRRWGRCRAELFG